ncbi:MAG: methylmalonyl Co-A mutase-associated GTPase MeaB [Deltaproteobacteria bacterium]|nr:methylmalonyl Co-A mutase-associated GTPase MeaB [Deltaproteobacteria bacterium]
MFKGDRTALARLITHVESRSPQMPEVMAAIESSLGRAQILGITGPPGAGKSTLVDQLIGQYRKLKKKVGVVAVDPSSPFTGGALLGDRIRMMGHIEDPDVFIRSLGSRGAHGGLSRATRDIVRLFDAFGMDLIIVETVGVGQTELDVLDVAHTTVVVLTPESGDTIQTLKAGLLEAADIFAVNKADREGAHKIHHELLAMIEMGRGSGFKAMDEWNIPVLQLQAFKGVGVEELQQTIDQHFAQVLKSPSHHIKQEKIRIDEFNEVVEEILNDQFQVFFEQSPQFANWKEEIKSGKRSPFEAVLQIKKTIKINI